MLCVEDHLLTLANPGIRINRKTTIPHGRSLQRSQNKLYGGIFSVIIAVKLRRKQRERRYKRISKQRQSQERGNARYKTTTNITSSLPPAVKITRSLLRKNEEYLTRVDMVLLKEYPLWMIVPVMFLLHLNLKLLS